jgi:tetratricopeptide (TPR) repeat protein
MWIDFRAEWCAPCKEMEKEVYSRPEFEQASHRFLPVRIDCDKKTAIARKYNIVTLPTIVFADSYGNELFRHAGYLGPQPLLDMAKALPGDVAEFNQWSRILSADRNNFEALVGIGRSLRAAGLFRASSEYYVKALQRHESRANLETREAVLNELGLNFLTLREGKRAAASFEKCLKEFPDSPGKSQRTLHLAEAYSLGDKNDRDKARTLLQAFLTGNPAGPQSQRAVELLQTLP